LKADDLAGREAATAPQARSSEVRILTSLTLSEIAQAVRDGALSASDVVSEALDSLDLWQPVTNAMSQIWPEEALAAARALPADSDLPLLGVPVLVKENMDVAGHYSTGCCAAFRFRAATEDALLVTRLRSAGAIVVGKASMHELAASGTNHVSACGPTHNPWDPQRLTGGSSGGSAAAVATRSVPLSIGTDTAGSVRIPSSFCGVTGLKSTQDRLSMRGVMPLAPSFDSAGPLAKSADDLALALAVLADTPDATGWMRQPLSGVQVGRVAAGYFAELIHPDVRAALQHVGEVLATANVRQTTVTLPDMDDALGVWSDIAWPEFASAYADLDLQKVGQQIADHYRYGQGVTEQQTKRAEARAFQIRDSFLAALRGVNALLLPCTPYAPPRFTDDEIDIGDGQTMNVFRGGPVWFTCPVDIAGLPSLALPAGFDGDGLPLGVQLVGRPGDELTLLKLGSAFQARTGHHRLTPPLPISSQTVISG
jgi:aspartyl-tRNA(Asn)/glutamyl-tRNA(Gln) amidotransferase subunit A